MLRVLIVTGLLLMGIGFGAAAWQYWSGMPAAAVPGAADGSSAAVADQDPSVWLASDTGAVIGKDEGEAYLVQDRLVPGRMLVVTRTALLSALLGEGETLPEPVFLDVFADIRAPVLADGICAALTSGPAADCVMHSARVLSDSIDRTSGTARFRLEFAYRLKPEEAELPDLATQVYRSQTIQWAPAEEDPSPADPASAVAKLVTAAAEACAGEAVGQSCRIVDLSLDWISPQQLEGSARIGWLDDLPPGIEPAPTLTPAPEN
jgi:hypothetical protein